MHALLMRWSSAEEPTGVLVGWCRLFRAGPTSWLGRSWPVLPPMVTDDADKAALSDLLQQGRMTSALAFVRELFHESTLGDVLADAYGKAVQVPAAITTVAQAPWRGLITTTFDALWASALARRRRGREPDGVRGQCQLAGRRPRPLSPADFGRATCLPRFCLAPAEIPGESVATAAASFVAGLYQQVVVRFRGLSARRSGPEHARPARAGRQRDAGAALLLAPQLSNSDARRVRTELGLVPFL